MYELLIPLMAIFGKYWFNVINACCDKVVALCLAM